MTHLTIALDEDILERARSKAQEEGTSVDALLRSYLEAYSNSREDREQAVKELLELSRKTTSGSGGRRATREELHERDALAETEHSGGPPGRKPFAALRALSGTAHSDFTNISTDKYAHVAAAAVETLDEAPDRS